jgi:hypothetical protein
MFRLHARRAAVAVLLVMLNAPVVAEEKEGAKSAGENASNPLASVDNTDLRYQYLDLGSADRNDFFR